MCRVSVAGGGACIVVMDVIWRRLFVSMILRKGDLFVLGCAMVRSVRWEVSLQS